MSHLSAIPRPSINKIIWYRYGFLDSCDTILLPDPGRLIPSYTSPSTRLVKYLKKSPCSLVSCYASCAPNPATLPISMPFGTRSRTPRCNPRNRFPKQINNYFQEEARGDVPSPELQNSRLTPVPSRAHPPSSSGPPHPFHDDQLNRKMNPSFCFV